MGKEFDIKPCSVPRVETKYRRIVTPVPHPDSVATLNRLIAFEPQSMRGQPPLVWDRAEDIFVYDKHGNRWLDWTSGVLVANCGHGAPEVKQAIIDQVQQTSPSVHAVRCRFEPVIGVVCAALEAAGVVVDEARLANLLPTIPPASFFTTTGDADAA